VAQRGYRFASDDSDSSALEDDVGDTWKRGGIYKRSEGNSLSDDESDDEIKARKQKLKGPIVKVDNQNQEVQQRMEVEQEAKAKKNTAPKAPIKVEEPDSGSETDTEEDDENWGYDTVKGRKIKDKDTINEGQKTNDTTKKMAKVQISDPGPKVTRDKLVAGTWAAGSGKKATARSTWRKDLWKQLQVI
jgi:hypothetical protein